jgi:hypothetical protein
MYLSLFNATQLTLCSSSLTIDRSSGPAPIATRKQRAKPFRLPKATGPDNDDHLQEIIQNLLRVSRIHLIMAQEQCCTSAS